MKRFRLIVLLVATLVWCLPSLVWADTAVDPGARKAVEAFLQVSDAGNFAAAWDQSADIVQKQIKKDAFVRQMTQARTPLGAVVKRSLASSQPSPDLPGAGKSVVLVYATSFARQAGLHEVVVASQGADGKWKISGYHFQ